MLTGKNVHHLLFAIKNTLYANILVLGNKLKKTKEKKLFHKKYIKPWTRQSEEVQLWWTPKRRQEPSMPHIQSMGKADPLSHCQSPALRSCWPAHHPHRLSNLPTLFKFPFPLPSPSTLSRWPHIPRISGTKRPGQQVGVPASSGVTSRSAPDTAPRTPLLVKSYCRQQMFLTCLYAFTTTSCPGSKVKEEKGWKIH